MKLIKLSSLLVALIMAFSVFQLYATASDVDDEPRTGCSCCAGDITVVLPEGVSPEIEERINAHFLGIEPTDPSKNILCDLFGHKIETGTTVTITHKVVPAPRRCLREVFNYEICSRCDYSQYTRIGYSYISCCS